MYELPPTYGRSRVDLLVLALLLALVAAGGVALWLASGHAVPAEVLPPKPALPASTLHVS
ncbi:MAG: hypothetical protein R3B99_36370 [Polyangiales bacterium]